MRATSLLVFAALATAALSGPTLAADMPVKALKAPPPPLAPSWLFEVGGRYWYSSATNRYDYYNDATTAQRNSRLSYDGMSTHSGEIFGRLDSPYRFFLKGYAGAGNITRGTLYDEDYPPAVVPYSKTQSDIEGSLSYYSGDLGYTVFEGRGLGSGQSLRVGAFAGIHYWRETAVARGCVQIGGGNVCDAGNEIANTITVIQEEDKWTAYRFGGVVDYWMTQRLKLTVDAAYVRVYQRAVDTHFFTLGVTPAYGKGNGVELEALVSYDITQSFNIGVGGRWWHYETDLNDNNNQLIKYKTDRFGAFVQGSYKFDVASR